MRLFGDLNSDSAAPESFSGEHEWRLFCCLDYKNRAFKNVRERPDNVFARFSHGN